MNNNLFDYFSSIQSFEGFEQAVQEAYNAGGQKFVYLTAEGWKALHKNEATATEVRFSKEALGALLKTSEMRQKIKQHSANYEKLTFNIINFPNKKAIQRLFSTQVTVLSPSFKQALGIFPQEPANTYNEFRRQLFEASYEDFTNLCIQVQDAHSKLLTDRIEFKALSLTHEVRERKVLLGFAMGQGGLNVIIAHLKKKAINSEMNCFVCKDLEAFKEILIEIKKSTFIGKIAIFVKAGKFRDHDEGYNHPSAVLIEKEADKICFFISDSLGVDARKGIEAKNSGRYKDWRKTPFHRGKCDFFSQNIYDCIYDADFSSRKIYFAYPKRQHDHLTCSVFAIDDMKFFLKAKSFFRNIEKYGDLKTEPHDDDVKYVQRLRPACMKLTQSLRELQKYFQAEKAVEPWFMTVKLDKKTEKKALAAIVKNVKRDQERQKFINTKALERLTKYLYIINKYMENSSFEDLTSMVQQFDSSKVKKEDLNKLNS